MVLLRIIPLVRDTLAVQNNVTFQQRALLCSFSSLSSSDTFLLAVWSGFGFLSCFLLPSPFTRMISQFMKNERNVCVFPLVGLPSQQGKDLLDPPLSNTFTAYLATCILTTAQKLSYSNWIHRANTFLLEILLLVAA